MKALLKSVLALGLAGAGLPAASEVYAPVAQVACQDVTYSKGDSDYDERHFAIRVFYRQSVSGAGFPSTNDLHNARSLQGDGTSCDVGGVMYRFDVVDYLEPAASGVCGSGHYGVFRLHMDDTVVWQAEPRIWEGRGHPRCSDLFTGTIDVYYQKIAICAVTTPRNEMLEVINRGASNPLIAAQNVELTCDTYDAARLLGNVRGTQVPLKG